MNTFEWQNIRHLVDTYEDMQSVRKAEMNRARMLVYRRLLELGYEVEAKNNGDEKPDFNDKKIDEMYTRAIEEGKLSKQEQELISNNTKYATKFKSLETEITKRIAPVIEQHPIWIEYLSKLKGIGTLTAARLICYLGDCSRFDTISKLWAYSGFKVENGVAQKRRRGEKGSWNPKVKVLGFLIADVFIKHRTAYRAIYDNERARLRKVYPEKVVNKETWDGVHKTRWNDGHIHAMAMRKMFKIFLANYWLFVRRMHGLPTRMPYSFEYEGHTTFQAPEEFFEKAGLRGEAQ